jgi:hypothetical protein
MLGYYQKELGMNDIKIDDFPKTIYETSTPAEMAFELDVRALLREHGYATDCSTSINISTGTGKRPEVIISYRIAGPK